MLYCKLYALPVTLGCGWEGRKMEYVSDKWHVKNLCYWRDLFKLELDDLTEKKKSGHIVEDDDAMEVITNISIIDEAIATVPPLVKQAEDGTKVVVRTDLKRLNNEAW